MAKKHKSKKAKKVVKKVAAKKTKVSKEDGGIKKVKDKMNRSQLVAYFVEQLDLNSLIPAKLLKADELPEKFSKAIGKKAVEAFENVIAGSLVKGGAGEFQLPGFFKVMTKVKPAQKGGEKKKNPFTGEMYKTKAKPAVTQVKLRALKKLKDIAAGN